MYNIQTLNKISTFGTDIFDKSKYAIADECAAPDAIMVRSAKMHDMQTPVFIRSMLIISRSQSRSPYV